MSDNSQKTHLGAALNFHSLAKALNNVHNIAKGLPATAGGITGSIMGALNFETQGSQNLGKASIPHFGPEYVRYPTQAGDKGVTFGANTDIGNMSGQGPSGGSFFDNSNTNSGNQSSGVFFPIANVNWEAAPSGNILYHYGVKPQQTQGGGGGEQQPFGVGLFDQVFSKMGGSAILSTDKDGNTTYVVRIGKAQPADGDTTSTHTDKTITHQMATSHTVGVGGSASNPLTSIIALATGHNITTPEINHKATTSHTIDTPQHNITGITDIAKLLKLGSGISQLTNMIQ